MSTSSPSWPYWRCVLTSLLLYGRPRPRRRAEYGVILRHHSVHRCRLRCLENDMTLHPVDVAVLAVYFAAMIGIGAAVVRHASQSIGPYFLGRNDLPWAVPPRPVA